MPGIGFGEGADVSVFSSVNACRAPPDARGTIEKRRLVVIRPPLLIERMFYFTPTFSHAVKRNYLKVLWQNIFSHHPGMQLKDQTPYFDHGIGADQPLSFGQR
jgi:hypothetical protein